MKLGLCDIPMMDTTIVRASTETIVLHDALALCLQSLCRINAGMRANHITREIDQHRFVDESDTGLEHLNWPSLFLSSGFGLLIPIFGSPLSSS
jgi:hypothetical protein